jgi:hypothetical protein
VAEVTDAYLRAPMARPASLNGLLRQASMIASEKRAFCIDGTGGYSNTTRGK